jgi:hypothetical protein
MFNEDNKKPLSVLPITQNLQLFHIKKLLTRIIIITVSGDLYDFFCQQRHKIKGM